eukprot:383106_1
MSFVPTDDTLSEPEELNITQTTKSTTDEYVYAVTAALAEKEFWEKQPQSKKRKNNNGEVIEERVDGSDDDDNWYWSITDDDSISTKLHRSSYPKFNRSPLEHFIQNKQLLSQYHAVTTFYLTSPQDFQLKNALIESINNMSKQNDNYRDEEFTIRPEAWNCTSRKLEDDNRRKVKIQELINPYSNLCLRGYNLFKHTYGDLFRSYVLSLTQKRVKFVIN